MVDDATAVLPKMQLQMQSTGRKVLGIACAFLVIASVYAPALLGMSPPPYELNTSLVVRGVLAMIGFLGLVAFQSHPGYLISTIIVTAIPGILALCFLVFSMLLAWTSGVHSFLGSWDPISGALAFTGPFFLPPVVAGALLIMRRRATRVKVAVVVVGIGVVYALFVYRWFFG